MAAAAVSSVLPAGAPATRAQEPAREAAVIRVDAVVTGPDGTPVRGLTRDDFDLLVRGERRLIEAFREVTRGSPEAPPAARLPADLPREVAANTYVRSGRLVVFVIDDRGSASARTAALEMLDAIGPDVPVGLAFAGGGPGVELTLDRVRLRAAIDAPPEPSLAARLEDESPWPGLTQAALSLADRERRRRAFVVIGTGAAHPPDEATSAAFEAAARDAGVAVYVCAPDGGGAHPRLVDLARETGGRVLTGAPPEEAMSAVLGDLDHHYLLSVTAAPGEGVERLADLAVQVRREGVVVRPRLGHHDEAVSARPPAEGPTGVWSAGVVPEAGVPMRASATPFPTNGGRVPVAVLLEVTVPRGPLEAVDPLLADEVDWSIQAVDLRTGQVRGERRTDEVAALRPRGTDPARHDSVQYELQSWIDLRPGLYQLRVIAASRALALGGSVFLTLDVPDSAAAPVKLGGFVFGHPAPAIDPLGPSVEGVVLDSELRGRMGGASNSLRVVEGPRAPRIPIRPAAARHFDRWEELKLFFEIGRRGAGGDARAEIEITDVLGRVVVSARPLVARDERTPVTVDIPLAMLAPGLYRVAATVEAGGTSARRDAAFVVNGVPPSPDALAAMAPPAASDPDAASAAGAGPPAAGAAGPPPGAPAAGPLTPAGGERPVRLNPDLSAADRLRLLDEANRLAAEGWERYRQGDVEGARARLAESVSLGNDSPRAHYALGLAEFALGRHEAAVAAFEFARRRQPDHQPVYFDLTDAYRALGRPDEALGVLRDAAQRWPGDPDVHNAMGVVHFNRGELDEAIGALERAVAAAPGDGLGYFNLARAYHARMLRWQADRSERMLTATRALADRDRHRAIETYTKALERGGSFEWEAREALRALSGGAPLAA